MTLRFGSASGNTITVLANRGTYVGTMRASANGQCEDSLAKRFVWNTYNRVVRDMAAVDTVDTWTYTTATLRQARANAANKVEYVCGLAEDLLQVTVVGTFDNTLAGVTAVVGVGIDSTTVNSAKVSSRPDSPNVTGTVVSPMAVYADDTGLGYHSVVWLEASQANGTTTWRGDSGGGVFAGQSGMSATIFA